MPPQARITNLTVNRRALQRTLNRSHLLRMEMSRRLASAHAYAQHLAPDETPIGEGYVAGLGWVILERNGELRGYLYSRDFKTLWIEYGTKAAAGHAATPAYRVLQKSIDALRRRK